YRVVDAAPQRGARIRFSLSGSCELQSQFADDPLECLEVGLWSPRSATVAPGEQAIGEFAEFEEGWRGKWDALLVLEDELFPREEPVQGRGAVVPAGGAQAVDDAPDFAEFSGSVHRTTFRTAPSTRPRRLNRWWAGAEVHEPLARTASGSDPA